MPILPSLSDRLQEFQGNPSNIHKLLLFQSIEGSKTGVGDFLNFEKSLNVN